MVRFDSVPDELTPGQPGRELSVWCFQAYLHGGGPEVVGTLQQVMKHSTGVKTQPLHSEHRDVAAKTCNRSLNVVSRLSSSLLKTRQTVERIFNQ